MVAMGSIAIQGWFLSSWYALVLSDTSNCKEDAQDNLAASTQRLVYCF